MSGLRSKITKSASFPASMEPRSLSSKFCHAASLVTLRRASSAGMDCSRPSPLPLEVTRLTAVQTNISGLTGVTDVSL